MPKQKPKGLLERLSAGEAVIVAEGYLFELEQRGYLKAGGFVPEVVLEHPDLVKALHHEFVHAGSDVVLAFTYYAHRQKMRLIGREDDLEKINKTALKIARQVADETGTLMAGNICNSTIFKPDDDTKKEIYEMMAEQVRWAVNAGADFIVGETFSIFGEAQLALKAIKENGNGLPAVITLAMHREGLYDGVPVDEACHRLEEEGADVVGLNCTRGPESMLPVMQQVKQACKGSLATVPVPYRTDKDHPVFQTLADVSHPEKSAFPLNLDAHLCSRDQITSFTKAAWNMGYRYIGLCCGNRSHYLRAMAEALGRSPPASKYSPDMQQHYSQIKDDRHSYMQSTFEKIYKDKFKFN